MLRKFFWQGVRTGILAFVQGLIVQCPLYAQTMAAKAAAAAAKRVKVEDVLKPPGAE